MTQCHLQKYVLLYARQYLGKALCGTVVLLPGGRSVFTEVANITLNTAQNVQKKGVWLPSLSSFCCIHEGPEMCRLKGRKHKLCWSHLAAF